MGGRSKPKTPEHEIVQRQNLVKNSRYALDRMKPINRELIEEATRDTSARMAGAANADSAAAMQNALRHGGMNKMGVMASTAGATVNNAGAMTSAAMQSGMQQTSGGMSVAKRGINSDYANNQMMLQVNTRQNQKNIADSAAQQARTNALIDFVGTGGAMMGADYHQFKGARQAGYVEAGDSWSPSKMRMLNGTNAWDNNEKMRKLYSLGYGINDVGRHNWDSIKNIKTPWG